MRKLHRAARASSAPARARLALERLESRVVPSADPFLKASGTLIRDGHGAGDPVLLQGTNLGGWLVTEGWMTPRDTSGLPDEYSARQTLTNRFGAATADSLFNAYEDAWIIPQDLDNIKALGMNVVRLPFWYRNLQDEDGTWRADAFDRLDWLVSNAWARGIYTILDLHGTPGGQSTAEHTGQVRPAAQLWTDPAAQQRTVDIWQRVAAHFNGHPGVAAYDLLNEPYGAPSQAALWSMYDRLYRAVRAADPDHMITLEAAWGNWNWDVLPNPAVYGWTNVLYQVHEYAWNSTNDPAGVMAGTDKQVNDFRAHQSWNVPCLVGEFNDFGPGANPTAVWDYAVQQFQANNMSWTEWSYKSSRGTGPDSWGIYDRIGAAPPVPNLQTDSAETIRADWSAWTTAHAFTINSMLRPALTVAVRTAFSDADIGTPGAPGGAAYDNTSGQWTVRGGGSGIGGAADQLNFASRDFSGDGSATARVIGVPDTDPGAEAGVMVRDGTNPAAAFAAVVVTPANGVIFQWRTAAGAAAAAAPPVAGLGAPVWVRLSRRGDTFTAEYSTDGSTWAPIGSPQTIALGRTARAGLAVTAHNNGLLATATFSGVSLLPADWTDADVGAPGLPGSTVFDPASGTWTLAGGGSDIWNAADQFHFASHSLTGPGSLVARVTGVQGTDTWAKAGVMFRDSPAAGAAFADVVVTPGQGVNFQWRGSNGGALGSVGVGGVTAPVWVKLTRAGNTFTGFYSIDGFTWTQIGGAQTVAMGATAQAGLAVTAHNNGLLNTATFTLPAPVGVPSVAVNDGAAQRSMVSSITVTFGGRVAFAGSPAAAFRLTRTGPGAPTGDVAVSVDLSGSTAAQTVARLTFSGPLTAAGSLVDGDYTLTVLGDQVVGPGGLPLDGNGDGQPGGDYTLSLYRLYGDTNGDRRVDALDLFAFAGGFGKRRGEAGYRGDLDANGDGSLDALDLFAFAGSFGTTLP